MELLFGISLPLYGWIFAGLSVIIFAAILKCRPQWIKKIILMILRWLDKKTKDPKLIATSPLIWILVIISCVYLALFGLDFSIQAWKKMLATHKGLVPFIIGTSVALLLIISVWRIDITIEPKWQTRLLILMPTVLLVSFAGHFLFFGMIEGIIEGKTSISSSVTYSEKTLPLKYATLRTSDDSHYQQIIPWEAVRIEVIENSLYEIENGRRQKVKLEDNLNTLYYTFGASRQAPITKKYVYITNNSDESIPLRVGLYPGTYDGYMKISVRYCAKITDGCPR